jgi:hypothetical protein
MLKVLQDVDQTFREIPHTAGHPFATSYVAKGGIRVDRRRFLWHGFDFAERANLHLGALMPISDVVFAAVSEVTGSPVSELTLRTVITDRVIGKGRQHDICSVLRSKLALGEWDWFAEYSTIEQLIRSATRLAPGYFDPGDMPDAIKVQTRVYRWHPAEHAPTSDPASLRTTFEDGPWKWSAQSRFAGKDLNPGHYFGLTEDAATAETLYYGNVSNVPAQQVLLSLDIQLNNVLNLAHLDPIVRNFTECANFVTELDYGQMAQYLIWKYKGGSVVTDYLGHYAHRQGYDGILFFGARAISKLHRQRRLVIW